MRKHHKNKQKQSDISPTRAGGAPRSGRRQSIPRCPAAHACMRERGPQHSELCRGQTHRPILCRGPRKSPALRHLAVKAEPLPIPVQQLQPVAPFGPRKADTAPLAAFCRSTSWARAANPSVPLRMPVVPQARQTRPPVPGPIMPPRPGGSAAPDHRRQSRPGTGSDDHSAARSPPWVLRCRAPPPWQAAEKGS